MSAEDEAQGLSCARVLDPMAPIVIVTNGDETRIFNSYTGQSLGTDMLPETQFVATINAAAGVAAGNLKQAIQTLMGNEPSIWQQAAEQLSDARGPNRHFRQSRPPIHQRLPDPTRGDRGSNQPA